MEEQEERQRAGRKKDEVSVCVYGGAGGEAERREEDEVSVCVYGGAGG